MKEIPKLVASHSQTEITQRIVNVGHYLSAAEETAKAAMAADLQDAFQHRMEMRKKVLGSLEPLTLKRDLLGSPLFSSELFPIEEFTKADEKAQILTSTPVIKGAYETQDRDASQSGWKEQSNSIIQKTQNSSNYKRKLTFTDPTIRKKTRAPPYNRELPAQTTTPHNEGNESSQTSDYKKGGQYHSHHRGKQYNRGTSQYFSNYGKRYN